MNTTYMRGPQVSVGKQAALLSSTGTVSLRRCIPNDGTLLHLSLVTSVSLCLFVMKYLTSETASTDEYIHHIVAVWSVAWGGRISKSQWVEIIYLI